MSNAKHTILVVDQNAEARASLARRLTSSRCTVLQAADGDSALALLRTNRAIRLVITELYLRTGECECLVQAMRQNRLRGPRAIAHTTHANPTDRAWAKRWGARGYLIQPAATERVRYVVSKVLASAKPPSGEGPRFSRRETLHLALGEIERGELPGASSVVIGGSWWSELTDLQRNDYRRRAREAGVSLRSDAMMGPHFVELRRRAEGRVEATPKSSPYRQ